MNGTGNKYWLLCLQALNINKIKHGVTFFCFFLQIHCCKSIPSKINVLNPSTNED